MRKVLIILGVLVLGLSQYGHSQDINFGVKGGLNLANLTGDRAERNNMVNFHAGVFTEFVLRRGLFGVQPEILFSRQGADRGDTYKVNLDYITVPVMLKFFLANRFSLDIGPQASFLLSDQAGFVNDPDSSIDTGAKNFDFGLNIGAGLDLEHDMFAQIRYNLGISKVYGNLNNSVFQLSIGYRF